MKINQPTTPKEYWALIQLGFSRNLVPHTSVTDEVLKQLTPLMHDNKDGKAIDHTIKEICDLPFPSTLGTVDSKEYDTMLAGIIAGLQNVIKVNGETPAPLPKNAPVLSTTIRSGAMSWQQGGSARAHDAWHANCVKEGQDAQARIDSLDSTKACKEALAKAYAGDPIKGQAKNWKRVHKENKGARVFRTFEAAGEQAQVIFNPSEDEPDKALVVHKEAPTTARPGQFPKILGPELNGQILFGLNTIEDDEVSFYCGPQTTDGHLSDSYDFQDEVRPIIQNILAGRNYDLYCAENFHTVKPAKGETAKELAAHLNKAMKAAGAIVENEHDIDL
jgi:hypothetical protein